MNHVKLFHREIGEWAGETFGISRDICDKIFSDKKMNPPNIIRERIGNIYYRMMRLHESV